MYSTVYSEKIIYKKWAAVKSAILEDGICISGDPGGTGGSPLEFVWDQFFFEFAINPSLPLHFVPWSRSPVAG